MTVLVRARAANNFVFGSVGTMTFDGGAPHALVHEASALRRINFIVFHELRRGDDSAVAVERVGLFQPVGYLTFMQVGKTFLFR